LDEIPKGTVKRENLPLILQINTRLQIPGSRFERPAHFGQDLKDRVPVFYSSSSFIPDQGTLLAARISGSPVQLLAHMKPAHLNHWNTP
jgi:hypothetical protein